MIITKNEPSFNKQADVVSCFVIDSIGRALFLKRQPQKPSGDKWGPPAGKVDPGETLGSAMVRELREETGLTVPEDRLTYLGSLTVRHMTTFDFIYHVFGTTLDSPAEITLNPEEHQSSIWATKEESLKLALVEDQATVHEIFWNIK